MGKIKTLFGTLGLLGVVVVGGYFYSKNSNSLLAKKIAPLVEIVAPTIEKAPSLAQEIKLPEDGLAEVSTLTERGKELTEHVGTVLGESVAEVDAEKQPLHERAMEYGQYLYCKGIVEEYETTNSKIAD